MIDEQTLDAEIADLEREVKILRPGTAAYINTAGRLGALRSVRGADQRAAISRTDVTRAITDLTDMMKDVYGSEDGINECPQPLLNHWFTIHTALELA